MNHAAKRRNSLVQYVEYNTRHAPTKFPIRYALSEGEAIINRLDRQTHWSRLD